MRWLLIPAADRAKGRRVVQRVDQILGYPRTHAEGDFTRHGGAPHAASVYTETQPIVMLHDATGATVLHGAIAISVNGVVDALRTRFIEIDGVRKRLSQWITDQGWTLADDLPGVASAWTQIAVRDGEAGSATGIPIAPGDE